jgi:hypothetical protein
VASGAPAMLGYEPACGQPSIELTGEHVLPLERFDGLVCFGNEDVTVTGLLRCSTADTELPSGGPDWERADRSCSFDAPDGTPMLVVYGQPVYDLVARDGQPVAGRFRVTGHYDDPQASKCRGGREGDPSDEAIQIRCRASFVATAVQRLDG